MEKFKNSNSQLISNRSLLCKALNTTDEKAQNLLVTMITKVVLFSDEMWCNLINIHISAIPNAELMFWNVSTVW